jgi:hypothetical protein
MIDDYDDSDGEDYDDVYAEDDICSNCHRVGSHWDECGVCGATMCSACFEMGCGVCKGPHR